MIITIDGADGCGKTTLADLLCQRYNFIHIRKPIDDILHVKNQHSIRAGLSRFIQHLIYDVNRNEKLKVKFNSSLLVHFKNALKNKDAIIERGPLSCYLFNGREDTESTFKKYIQKWGINFDLCIYLKASKNVRIERLKKRNPNDNDFLTDKILRLNDNEENTLNFAKNNNFNIKIIDTDSLNIQEVFFEACKIIDKFLNEKQQENNFERM